MGTETATRGLVRIDLGEVAREDALRGVSGWVDGVTMTSLRRVAEHGGRALPGEDVVRAAIARHLGSADG